MKKSSADGQIQVQGNLFNDIVVNASVTEDMLAEANAPITRYFSLPMSASRSRLVHSDTDSVRATVLNFRRST